MTGGRQLDRVVLEEVLELVEFAGAVVTGNVVTGNVVRGEVVGGEVVLGGVVGGNEVDGDVVEGAPDVGGGVVASEIHLVQPVPAVALHKALLDEVHA